MSKPVSESDKEILTNFFNVQDKYRRPNHRSAFWNYPVTNIILKSDGWKRRSVDVSLDENTVYVILDFLQVKNIAFYKPIEKVYKGEFEHFFGFGNECSGFSTDCVRFMHITDDISIDV